MIAVSAALAGCAVSLDRSEAPPPLDAATPRLSSCDVFADPDRGVLGATGRVQSFDDSGTTVITVGELQTNEGATGPLVFAAAAVDPDAATCRRGEPPLPASAALDASALGAPAELLAPFVTTAGRFAFVATSAGVALATWDAARASYVAPAEYLFTADRPTFGDAALAGDDGFVYAYGCRSTSFLTDSCYVARAPAARIADRTAYTFYRGGGDFGPDVDDAWPIFVGGRGLTVTAHDGRVLAAYVTPLGTAITLRVGLAPSGPWSQPVEVTACDVPEGAFCGGLGALPSSPGELVLTYTVASFDPLPVAERLTRLVHVPMPSEAAP